MEVTQSNAITGRLQKKSASDLTGKEGHLVKLVDATGLASVDLPAANTDCVQFVVGEAKRRARTATSSRWN